MSIGRTPCLEGSGNETGQTRTVEPFASVALTTEAAVTLHQGAPQNLNVATDDNLLPIISTTVAGDLLTVAETECFSTELGVDVAAQIPTIEGISVGSSGSVRGSGLNLGNASITVSGSGSISFDGMSADSIDIENSASGAVEVSGSAGAVTVKSTGSGATTADDCPAASCDVTVSGSGNVRVNATATLKATITGSGNIYYRGNPAIERHITGSGKLIAIP